MTPPALDADLTGLDPAGWQDRLAELGEERGHYDRLGSHHACLFVDEGRTLLVTFETMDSARRQPGARPRGLTFAAEDGWSVMTFLSDGDTWFRDPAVWRTLDRLTDDGFFEDFDRVLFFGAGSAGHAACAMSVAAPGARVLAVRPQATLAPTIAGWDRRHLAARRRDFASRYGYAPDMIDAALSVHLVVDPVVALDAVHAAMFTRPHVTVHRCANAGPRTEAALDTLGLTPALIRTAMDGTLTPAAFGRLWRARRDSAAYLRLLLRRLENDGRTDLVRRLCLHGAGTPHAALFAERLAALSATEAAE